MYQLNYGQVLSIKTVEKHRNNLKGKLDIYDTAGLTCYAINAGIIECSPPITVLEEGPSISAEE